MCDNAMLHPCSRCQRQAINLQKQRRRLATSIHWNSFLNGFFEALSWCIIIYSYVILHTYNHVFWACLWLLQLHSTSHPTNCGQLSADAIGSPGQAFRRMQKAIAVGGATCLRDGRLWSLWGAPRRLICIFLVVSFFFLHNTLIYAWYLIYSIHPTPHSMKIHRAKLFPPERPASKNQLKLHLIGECFSLITFCCCCSSIRWQFVMFSSARESVESSLMFFLYRQKWHWLNRTNARSTLLERRHALWHADLRVGRGVLRSAIFLLRFNDLWPRIKGNFTGDLTP